MERQIFKRASSTFYWSSLFFPTNVRHDVFDLYSFVRVADDYVDQTPADKNNFKHLRKLWEKSEIDPEFNTTRSSNDSINERVVKNIIRLVRDDKVELEWIEKFLDSMQSDLDHKKYETLDDILDYVHGSAENIGLIMARIMKLTPKAVPAAMLQGRAFQWINFIRDIKEDNQFGRQYFPAEDLKKFNLSDLSKETATNQPDDFKQFIQYQIDRYNQWQTEAKLGYKYIPKHARVPLMAAVDMYEWTARQIEKDPHKVLDKKIKPNRIHLLSRGLYRHITDKNAGL